MNWHYLYVFFQSNGLEVLFLLGFYQWFQSRDRVRPTDIALRVTLANTLTHPIVLFIILRSPLTYLSAILVAEAFAIVAEAILHRYIFGISWKKAVLGSTFANLLSWQMGTMLTTWIFLQDRISP